MTQTTIILKDLPKISLNKFYGGIHYRTRIKLKNDFFWAVRTQTKLHFKKDKCYIVEYHFTFKKQPLDCSNATGGMVKLLEDILFEDDSPNCVKQITVSSRKGISDFVTMNIRQVEPDCNTFHMF